MSRLPTEWIATELSYADVVRGEPLARSFGWTFWEHPQLGDGFPVLAISLDRIGDHGPIVYNTGDYDVPEYL